MADSNPATAGIFAPGDLLNNTYRIETLLGKGGVSEVYTARSEVSGRVVAVKALRAEYAANEDFQALMTREEAVREIRHDAVVRYFDAQRMASGVIYLVMDYVAGPGLDRVLKEGGLPQEAILVLGRRIAEGLSAAHARGIVHRDLSPDNIILRDGKPDEAVIIDFGIAKDTRPEAATIVGDQFAGKYAYAAPEQLGGRADPRTDLYSLGAVLLAVFRGKAPRPGSNPLEVVEAKGHPLDLNGVPEPLAGLIARMAAPDPAARFQTAAEAAAAFAAAPALPAAEAPAVAEEPDILDTLLAAPAEEDRTVIAPASAPAPARPAPPQAAAPPKTGRKALMLAAPVLVAAGGAGLWIAGVFDATPPPPPPLPVESPYVLIVEKTPEGQVRAAGSVPSETVRDALAGAMGEGADLGAVALASGDIPEDWGAGMVDLIARSTALDEFRIATMGGEVRLTGLAPDQAAKDDLTASLAATPPAGLSLATEIAAGPRILTAEAIRPVLEAHEDCGPLFPVAAPAAGYALGDPVVIAGRVASPATAEALRADLAAVAGDRAIRVETATLNEPLCRVDQALPFAGPGGFGVRFADGATGAPNPSGRFRVGENPVIDVTLPEGAEDGYLWVSIVDVKGVVFHLLPNRIRPENSLAALRQEATDGRLRVAYDMERALADGVIGFTVDDTTLGQSQVLVIRSRDRLFQDLRPISESAASYAEALAALPGGAGGHVDSIDTATLVTER